MKLFCAIVGEYTLLPHFLKHYSAVGIDHFFFAVDEAIASSVESVTRHWPCTVWRTPDAAESVYGVKAVSDMRRRHFEPDEWVVIADLDELYLYPAPLPTLISSAETEGSNNIRGTMVEMLAEDGAFHLCRHRTETCGRSFRAGAPSPEIFEGAPIPSAGSFVERHRPTTA